MLAPRAISHICKEKKWEFRMAQAAGDLKTDPPVLVFIGTVVVIIGGRSKGNISLPYFLNLRAEAVH